MPSEAPAGTVKFEFDIPIDPKATVTVAGNDYTPKELEQDIKLKPGTHQIAVKQPGLNLDPQEFGRAERRGEVRVCRPAYPAGISHSEMPVEQSEWLGGWLGAKRNARVTAAQSHIGQ